MTTKIIVLCPDNSLHDVQIYIEKRDHEGNWLAEGMVSVAPREQSEPIYIDAETRITVNEEGRERVQPLGGK